MLQSTAQHSGFASEENFQMKISVQIPVTVTENFHEFLWLVALNLE
jgi:hypothetical protein